MTRLDWYIGLLLAIALAVAALAWPRYEWRDPGGAADLFVRIDRWTGRAELGTFRYGGWTPFPLPTSGRVVPERDIIDQIDDALREVPTVRGPESLPGR